MKITNRFIKTTLLSASMMLSQQSLAAAIDPEIQPLGAIGPLELSTTDLTNGATAYRGWFENGSWQGDLIEYSVAPDGGLFTSINTQGLSPTQGAAPGATADKVTWSAYVEFKELADSTLHWQNGRKIITLNDGKQVPFRWNTIDPAYKQGLDEATDPAGAADASAILNFLRGKRTDEAPNGIQLRQRFGVLGDIVHSNPEYVGTPEGSMTDSSYIDFKNDLDATNSNLGRKPRVYVGANDGMLHAFDADTGIEEWAYVPSMLTPKLSILAGVPYAHRYFVDGGINVRDAYANGAWRTVLVGSLGAGGKGLFALDVTDPELSSETADTGGDKKVIWEIAALKSDGTSANDDIGYIFDVTPISKLNDGKWYAVFGNGIASANGQAKLMLKEIRTDGTSPTAGAIATDGNAVDNGLAAPALVDIDNDGKVDFAWAGDIKGNMWRFDLRGPGPWTTAGVKVFSGQPGQPITLAPDVTSHPQFGHLIFFGTGKLYTKADITDKTVQAIYGIWDKGPGTTPSTQEPLVQTLSPELAYSAYNDDLARTFTETVRNFTTTATVNYGNNIGWKVELAPGLRLLTPPQLRGGRVKTTITDPDGYSNWFFEASFDNGFAADGTIFNLNRDNQLDLLDRVDANNNSKLTDSQDIPMAWKRPDGNMSQVTIASLKAGRDTLFLNYLLPPAIELADTGGCTGDCTGGIVGGHIDADYTLDFLADKGTTAHEHEYDKKVQQTYVDYYDLIPDPNPHPDSPGGKAVKFPQNIDQAVANLDERFVVIIANADLSKGGTLTLNKKEYNVVKYQREIHKALYNWDGVTPADLKDSEGDPLTYTLQEIITKTGTLRLSFNSLAIVAGGLHPTQTGCVKEEMGKNSITGKLEFKWVNDRWRNGALTIQLIKTSHFASPVLDRLLIGNPKMPKDNALDRLYVQQPTDFSQVVYLTDGKPVFLSEDLNKDGGINTNPGDHEIFGGLRLIHPDLDLATPDEFIYEATVFWHFGKLYAKTLLLVEPCYGDPLWKLAYVIETQGAMDDLFQELLEAEGFADLDELRTEIERLANCNTDICTAKKDEKGDLYDDIYQAGLLVEEAIRNGTANGSSGTEDGSGGSTAGLRLPTKGEIDLVGDTLGPNFDSGRRTWIDILPQ